MDRKRAKQMEREKKRVIMGKKVKGRQGAGNTERVINRERQEER